jgi:hypothetical protein
MPPDPDVPSPDQLDADDLGWARELATVMITATMEMVDPRHGTDPEAMYAAARDHALSVRQDDGRGADRWLAAMFFLAAHSAGLVRQVARHEAREPAELWQATLLRRLRHPSP